MQHNTEELLKSAFGISSRVISHINTAEKEVGSQFEKLDDIMAYNQYKVLKAFQECRISDVHFGYNTGYGYNDQGRDALEKLYAAVFGAEAALVRPIIVNGTHALSLMLAGVLRPGDELIYCTGSPYDTLWDVIGLRGEGMGSLKEFGISYNQVELTEDGSIDLEGVKRAITPSTKAVAVQRATGYAWRKAITIEEIQRFTSFVKSINENIICLADNCYGEFLDLKEPTEAGIDLMAGSLIKNPGGGLALSGGYVAGREDLVEKVSYRMTSPGLGGECGLMFDQTRTMMQGLFFAPSVVNGAVKGATLCGKVFENLGFEVCPGPFDKRSDIIQGVKFGNPDAMIAFCEGIQAASPVDAHVTPVPWEMPGYEDEVIMAAGAFIQGSSIELSADGPMREPYVGYFQGGLTYEHSKFGVIKAMDTLEKKGLL